MTDKPLNAVRCLPNFHKSTQTSHLPLDGQDIQISLPVRGDVLETAMDAATSAYESQLGSLGINIHFTKINTVCVPSNNHCIEIHIQTPPNLPTACAQTSAYAGADGNLNQHATIYVWPGYNNNPPITPDYLKSIVGHELGHLFNLDDHDPQCADGSIMNVLPSTTCNGDMSGLSSTPQPSDVLPVAKSTYGTTPKKMCG